MAADQKSGARGLRAILESALLDIMYDTPGQNMNEVIINEDVIEKHGELRGIAVEVRLEHAADPPDRGVPLLLVEQLGRDGQLAVAPVAQTERLVGGVVHRRRARVRDRVAEDAG